MGPAHQRQSAASVSRSLRRHPPSPLRSPGWQCEDNQTAAGTNCTYEIGFLPSGASGGEDIVFAVLVDRPLPQDITKVVNSVLIVDEIFKSSSFAFSLEILLSPTGLDGEEPLTVKVFLPVSMR